MTRYLFTCECGQNVPVEVGQAGGQVTCADCGRQLDVPTLRTLRHLPTATEASPSAEASRSTWGPRQGIITAAALLAVVLLLVAGYSRLTEPTIPEFNPQARMQSVDTALEDMTPAQGWDLWVNLYRPMAERGLAVMEDPHKPAIEQYVAKQRFFQMTMLAAAGVCAAVAIVAFAWPTGRRPQSK